MKNNIRLFCAMVILGLTAACGALPHTAEVRTEITSTLVFRNGPQEAVVLIDGHESGHLTGKETVFVVSNGTHDVSVHAANGIIFQKTIFIEDGTRKVIPLSK